MKIETVQRNKFIGNIYHLNVSKTQKEKAYSFAKKIIDSENQYLRLTTNEILKTKNIKAQQKLEIQRTYIGKLGEIIFADFLEKKGKPVDTSNMFEIYEGKHNVDEYDFFTKSGKTVDVKTGFRPCHRLLAINKEQFDDLPKDYYVAIKFNGRDTGSPNEKLIDLSSITNGTILGYAEYNFLKKHAKEKNLGEGLARIYQYEKLLFIDRLVNIF